MFSIDAVAEFEDFVEDMYDFAEQALSVDTLIHENGAAQLELTSITATLWIWRIRSSCLSAPFVKLRSGFDMYATFMAKPI